LAGSQKRLGVAPAERFWLLNRLFQAAFEQAASAKTLGLVRAQFGPTPRA
jgi:hypothetical protein